MKLIPTFIIFLFLIFYLSISTFKMFNRAYVLYQKESEDKEINKQLHLEQKNTNE